VVLTLKVRQGIVYLATAVFFGVAITAQMQGAGGMDVYVKAGAACLILVAGGLGLVHILDDAAAKMQRLSAAQAEGIKAGAAGGEPMAQGQA
jgi:hypothetical protein